MMLRHSEEPRDKAISTGRVSLDPRLRRRARNDEIIQPLDPGENRLSYLAAASLAAAAAPT